MDLRELLELLDIEEPSDFQYFENLADIMEYENEIPYDTLYLFIKKVDSMVLSELLNDYFEELQNSIPDAETDIYMLLNNISLALTGISKNMEEEEDIRLFTDEFDKFRRWYISESTVAVREKAGTGEYRYVTIAEALTLSRMEKLTDEHYEYDFSNAAEYELTDYVMSFKDIIDVEEDNDGELQDGFVYDDEL